MKRFLADVLLICILVSIGSYWVHSQERNTNNLQEKVDHFEESVAQNSELDIHETSSGLNDIEDNRAARLAKNSSDVVVRIIESTVSTFASLFEGIMN